MPLVALVVAAYAGGLLVGLRSPSGAAAPVWGLIAVAAALLVRLSAGSPGAAGRVALRRGIVVAVACVGIAVGWSAAAAPAKRGQRPPPALLAPLRVASIAAIDRSFGADAPLARALLVADRSDLPLEIRDRFSSAGLAHVLSISGLHVGIAAMSIELLVRALGAGAAVARTATLAVLVVYVAMLGAPPPALRAATMFGAVAAARWRGRPTSSWAALAVGAAVPLLLDPRAVASIGWQLSAGGVASLIAAGKLATRIFGGRLEGWRRTLAEAAIASTVASFASAPIVAWHFGRVSLVGPLANLAAAPVVAVMQPTLFLALVLAPLPSLSKLVAAAAHPMLRLLDAIAGHAAALPAASPVVAPTMLGAALALGGVVATLAAFSARQWERHAVVAAALLGLLAWTPYLPSGTGRVELHVIDVGQGDAVAIRTARGRWILIDAGRAWRGGDAGRATIVPHLRRRGGELVAFVLSHPHSDHVGGGASVIRSLSPRYFYDAGFVAGTAAYRQALQAASDGRSPTIWRRVRPGDSLVVDGVRLRFLAPDSAWAASLRDPNDASTVVVAEVGRVRFLLTGDAELAEEEWLLEHHRDALAADVLKVGHHGSRTSSDSGFIAAIAPRLALISVGTANMYGHPSDETLITLERQGAEIFRTDLDGTIIVETDGRRIAVRVDGRRWELR
jgi:competence protein ComEC